MTFHLSLSQRRDYVVHLPWHNDPDHNARYPLPIGNGLLNLRIATGKRGQLLNIPKKTLTILQRIRYAMSISIVTHRQLDNGKRRVYNVI
jgi:hypothetical protein